MDLRMAREAAVDGATWFVRIVNPHLDESRRGKKGGWICIMDPGGEIVVHEQIGEIGPEKPEKYQQVSKEKATRLRAHPEHRTSWQSRNPEQGQWGGAIRTIDGWIFSFSGLPELWDEALMLGCVSIYDMELYMHMAVIASPGVEPLVDIIYEMEDRYND